jgi:hypothetical protein
VQNQRNFFKTPYYIVLKIGPAIWGFKEINAIPTNCRKEFNDLFTPGQQQMERFLKQA